MSTPFSSSKNASPLVRSRSEVSFDSRHGLAPEAPRKPARTNPTAAPSLPPRAKTFAPSTRTRTHDDKVLQLSERDSIFATHYVSSDSFPTTSNGSQSTASVPELTTPLPPQANTPSLLACELDSSSASPPGGLSGSASAAPHRSLTGPASINMDGFHHHHHLLHHHHLHQHLHHHPKNIITGTYTFRVSSAEDTADVKQLQSPALDKVMTADDNARQVDGDKAASSRDHTDRQIEATIASEGPVPNARSRKASHYLGLFKENNGGQDQKKSKDQATDGGRRTEGSDNLKRREGRDKLLQYNASIITPNSHPSPSADTLTSRHIVARPDPGSRFPQTSGEPTDRQFAKRKEKGVASKSLDEENIEWRSASPSEGSFPLRLLEEIRNHPHRRSRPAIPKRMVISDALEELALSKSDTRYNTDESRSHTQTSDSKADDEEEYESDKEHISSATYYPHEAPSPEILDHGLDEIPGSPDALDEQSPLPSPQVISLALTGEKITSEPEPHSAVALKSKSQVHFVQKDLGQPSGTSETDAISSTASSASDTDYESDATFRSETGEESGTTDNGEMTPTVTPRARKQYSRSRKSRAPLGAVELKPYKHQVGGHTKVFSFSKQAICKQLNNRENEFYEVIERRHPELLRFMPRYLGVLNVTYQKAPRRKKKKEGGDALPDKADSASQDSGAAVNPDHVSTAVPGAQSRTISHSQYFEGQEETVPQVIYANNLHIIPSNLFRRIPLLNGSARPWTANGPPSDCPTINFPKDDMADILSRKAGACHNKYRRPSLHKQYPSWGSTTVNQKLKERVLRDVFSPPPVHRRGHGRHAKCHKHFSSLRGLLTDASDAPGRRMSTDGTPMDKDNSVDGQRPSKLRPCNRRDEEREGFSATSEKLNRADLTMLEKVHSTGSDAISTSPPESRHVHRRRSENGLRRKQYDFNNSNSRSVLEYYEDEEYGGDLETDIFALDLEGTPSRLPKHSTTNGERLTGSTLLVPEAERNEALSADTGEELPPGLQLGPVNPLQAQMQADSRVRHFLLLEDLTANMVRPCVLDLKMGTRQYGIEANKKKQASQRQKCKVTTSRQLGVRLCGMQIWNAKTQEYTFEDKYAGRDLKAGREFQDALTRFLYDGKTYLSVLRHIPILLEKLSKLESIIRKLPKYRFYASSLLMLYDGAFVDEQSESGAQTGAEAGREKRDKLPASNVDIKLVDFANCVTSQTMRRLEAECPPREAEGVDRGYIRGLRSLRQYLQRIWKDINNEEWMERGEGEGMGLRQKGAGDSELEGWRKGWEEEDPGEVSV